MSSGIHLGEEIDTIKEEMLGSTHLLLNFVDLFFLNFVDLILSHLVFV